MVWSTMADPPGEGPDPEAMYGPTSAWQGQDVERPQAPASTDSAPQDPPAPRQITIDQDALNALDRRYNAALADFASSMKKDLLEALDQKLVATFNTQAALNSPTQPAVDGQAQPSPTPASGPNLEALATAVMPIVNMIAQRFLKIPAAEAPAGILQTRFKEVADVVTMVNQTFMANHDESMRTGMKLTADAFTYAYKATGNVPDGAAFNASIGPPAANPPAAPSGSLSRTTFDIESEASRIAAKITTK